jgi:hypothetical protein
VDSRRQSFKTGYEYQAINTQIDDFNPKYGATPTAAVQPPATAAADPATYNLADFMFGLRNATRSSTRSSPTSASGCTSLLQDDFRPPIG